MLELHEFDEDSEGILRKQLQELHRKRWHDALQQRDVEDLHKVCCAWAEEYLLERARVPKKDRWAYQGRQAGSTKQEGLCGSEVLEGARRS